MKFNMTNAVRDTLAVIAYGAAHKFNATDREAFLSGPFARGRDLTAEEARALYDRGRDLARRGEKGRAA